VSVTWKRLVLFICILFIVGSAGAWWINDIKSRWFSVEFDTTQTEADFSTHQERVEFLSDLTALKVPTSATDITFTKEGWQDHSILGRFRLAKDHIGALVASIPKIKSHSAGVYEYTSYDGRTSGRLRVNRTTGWMDVEAYYD